MGTSPALSNVLNAGTPSVILAMATPVVPPGSKAITFSIGILFPSLDLRETRA